MWVDSNWSSHLCSHCEGSARVQCTCCTKCMGSWLVPLSKQKIQVLIATYKSVGSPLISEISFPSFPSQRQDIIPPGAGARGQAVPSTTFWSSLLLASSLLLTWRVSTQAHGQAACRHSSFLWLPWLLASGHWLLSTLADPPREACAAHRRGLWNIFPASGRMLFSTVLSEVKRFLLHWQQGLVLVCKKRHLKKNQPRTKPSYT